MIEVGDMFLYIDDEDEAAFDIGWVVHTETHFKRAGERANLIYIKWLRNPDGSDDVDSVWQHHIEEFKEFTLVKGGQYER